MRTHLINFITEEDIETCEDFPIVPPYTEVDHNGKVWVVRKYRVALVKSREYGFKPELHVYLTPL